MKTARNVFLFLAVFCAVITLAVHAQDKITAAPAMPVPVTVIPAPVLETSQINALQSSVTQWVGFVMFLTTALAGLVAHVLAKVSEVKERLNRQSDRTGQLQSQVVDLAKAMPGPGQAPPQPAATGNGGVSALITGALILGLLFSGCAARVPTPPPPPLTPEQRAAELAERAAAREQWRAIGFGVLGGIAKAGTDFAVNRLEEGRGFRK